MTVFETTYQHIYKNLCIKVIHEDPFEPKPYFLTNFMSGKSRVITEPPYQMGLSYIGPIKRESDARFMVLGEDGYYHDKSTTHGVYDTGNKTYESFREEYVKGTTKSMSDYFFARDHIDAMQAGLYFQSLKNNL